MTNRAKIKRASHSSGIRWFSGSALFRAGLFGLRCWTTFVKLQDFNLREAASAVHLAVLRASRRSGGLPALRGWSATRTLARTAFAEGSQIPSMLHPTFRKKALAERSPDQLQPGRRPSHCATRRYLGRAATMSISTRAPRLPAGRTTCSVVRAGLLG